MSWIVVVVVVLMAERTPNVVFVLADDLGPGEVGCYGQEKIRTPHIDRLAAEGMRFESHYSGSPVCAPSRCVVLTGKHTGHSVVRDNWENGGWGEDAPEGQYPLPEGTDGMGLRLKAAGYRTACVGKWGLGGPETSGHPNRQGFDLFFGHLCQRKAHNYYPTHLWRNEERVVLEGNPWFSSHQRIAAPLETREEYAARFAGERYAPDLMLDAALEFIEQNRERPFFLWYTSPIPHASLQVPDEYVERYPASWDERPYLGDRGYLPHPRPRAAYAGMVSHLDDEVGRIVERLERLGIADDTIVIFSSDNGPTFNGGTDSTFFDSASGRRGLKCSVYEGGIRVPMIVRWPGKVAAGSVTRHVSAFWDIYPTIAEMIGVPVPPDVDGISFAPTLLGRGAQRAHELLYWEYARQQAVRRGAWKLVRHWDKEDRDRVELFRIDVDPNETWDVAAAYPHVVSDLLAEARRSRVPSEPYPCSRLDAESAADAR